MRTTERVTVTIPRDLMDQVRDEVAAGRASSVSSWVTDAIRDRSSGEDVLDVIHDLYEKYGYPTDEERTWAKQILSRSYWTQERSSRSKAGEASPGS